MQICLRDLFAWGHCGAAPLEFHNSLGSSQVSIVVPAAAARVVARLLTWPTDLTGHLDVASDCAPSQLDSLWHACALRRARACPAAG